ncbi:hypothetical protein QUF76_18605, partial [Desulfobacterales bacterium HSG16]|nr:hypothetical protein [Desulfobacterales bacterium HSG16]
PIRYRYLEGNNQFSKYQWINVKLSKAASDSRPESFNIYENSIKIGDKIETKKYWNERKEWVLDEKNIYGSIEELYETQKNSGISLGIVRLKELIKFSIESKPKSDIEQALKKKNTIMSQLDMFEDKKELEILPVRFVLHFRCEGSECKGHRMSILDWEFAQLYRNVKNNRDWKSKIENKVNEICGPKKDTYLILGNMAKRQHIFCILGFFYPPKKQQLDLF